MFGRLSEKLQSVVAGLAGKKKLSEDNISDAVRQVRMALLEADVNYGVTKTFVKRVKEKALGEAVLKAVSPGQQFIKVVHDELAELMGGGEAELALEGKPAVILLCGLQGSGKTTSCAKLAAYLKKQFPRKKSLLVACDLQRPAAIEQLHQLGKQIETEVFSVAGEARPQVVAKAALKKAKLEAIDFLICDSAGRLHVDDTLMDELSELKKILSPGEVLFVANATTGQDAVNSAAKMHEKVGITGSILTMLDSDARGGAAISVREVTGQPLKFEGIGERVSEFQLFNADSMADRILGMGDTINLVKRAQEEFSDEESAQMEQKLKKASFTFDDYLSQFERIEKMGSLKGLLKMLPMGIDQSMLEGVDEKFAGMKAIIQSMTPKERRGEVALEMGRRRRLAKGSGRPLEEVNKLIKSFKQTKQMLKKTKNHKKLSKLAGVDAWH